ncbi:helix-turn-helix domain-containing protein [Nocardia sp. CA-129566]|uniref:helix-turn-helix domain-containing protein n=1 Tax=Nocardia sp. CA-129566 TaxID=3239976 RepID=UPI003D95CFB4
MVDWTEDVAFAALGTADPELALVFVTGGVVVGPQRRHHLGENRSRNRAAERLSAHPKTVSYRVHHAEALLGRSVERLDLGPWQCCPHCLV